MNENKKSKKLINRVFSEHTSLILTFIGIGLIIASIIIFITNGSWEFSNILDEAKAGQFGDFMGGVVGTILAFVGVILFYIALTEQRKDIEINRDTLNIQIKALNKQIDEFKEQKNVLEKSRLIYEQQSSIMKVQQFESNFYSLLNVYLRIKEKSNVKDNDKDYFHMLFDKLSITIADKTFFEYHNAVLQSYINVYLDNRVFLSQYFKTIYRLIRLIDQASIADKEKVTYSKIFRSQLSDYELLLLYYNGHSHYGIKFRNLILKYNLLKHLRSLNKIEFLKRYPKIKDEFEKPLILFTEWIAIFLIDNLEESYDIESDPINVSQNCEIFNCIVELKIDVKIEINIYCDQDIKKNDIDFDSKEFLNFMTDYLYDILFHIQFRIPEENEIQNAIIQKQEKTIFEFTIKTDKKIGIIKDRI